MARSCCIQGCGKKYLKTSKRTFHCFPVNQRRRQEWTLLCQLGTWAPNAFVCSDHFRDEDFDRTGQTVRLRDNVVPSRKLPEPNVEDLKSVKRCAKFVEFNQSGILKQNCVTRNGELVQRNLKRDLDLEMDAPDDNGIVVCERRFSTYDPVAGAEGGLLEEVMPTPFPPISGQPETNVADVCRACLSHENLTNMRQLEFEGVNCVQLYETLTDIQVKPTDGISQSLCEACFATATRFYKFRSSCIRSEKILNGMLEVVKEEITIHQPITEDHHCSQQIDHSRTGHDETNVKSPQSFNRSRYSIILESPQTGGDETVEVVRYSVVPHIDGGHNHSQRTTGLSVASNNSEAGTEDDEAVCNEVTSDSIQSPPDDSSDPHYLDEIISFLVEEVVGSDDGDDVETAMPLPRRPPKAHKKTKTKRRRLREVPVKVFSCFCGLNFTTHADFCDHRQKEKHFARRFHTCPLCQKNFKHPKRLLEHMNVHTKEKPNACDSCEKAFTCKANLRRHIQTAHKGQNRFMCDTCGREFTTKFAMDNHITNHKGEKPYLCHYCGKQFCFYPTFKLHVMKHAGNKAIPKKFTKTSTANKKLHVCECGKTFMGQSYYIHRRTHLDVLPYLCKFCGKRFAHSGTLKTHVYTHTGERPFKCDLCGKRFTHAGTLKSHVYTHTGEKPYKCEVCGKGFTQGQHLKMHTLVHKDEKPFQCTICKRGFRQKAYLTAHMNGHLGIRPYKCEVCGKGFCDQTTMKKHRKRLHPISE